MQPPRPSSPSNPPPESASDPVAPASVPSPGPSEQGPGEPAHQARVEGALVEFLMAAEAAEEAGQDFDAFCAGRPDMADELRELYATWQRVGGVFERLQGAHTFKHQLALKYGGSIDPGISLDQDRSTSSGSSTEGLLERMPALQQSSNRYTFRNEIARGGMGAIFKVTDENLRRALAMKVMLFKHREASEDESQDPNVTRVSRFLEEAQITGQLDHPGIVPVHEMGMDGQGRLYFTMPLVKGKDLKDIIEDVRRGKENWTQTRALGAVLKVCEAMAFAHSKGVIHRDLKPANIMVGRFGETYVMDWGLAKVLGREETRDIRLKIGATSTLSVVHTHRRDHKDKDSDSGSPIVTLDGDVVGTPAYMSPEQAQGRIEEIGPQSDVYSVGAMLYHLLTGQMPYVPLGERVSPHTVLNAVRNGPPWKIQDAVKDVPEELVAICDKAMARSLHDRYADMMAMADDLRAFLEGRVVRAYETGAIAEFKKWVVRNKGMAAALGLLILLTAVGVGIVIRIQAAAYDEVKAAFKDVETARDDAERERKLADERSRQAVEEKDRADANFRLALEERNRADENAKMIRQRAYQAALIAADYSLRLYDVPEALKALAGCAQDRRGWEWEHLSFKANSSLHSLVGESLGVSALALAEDTGEIVSVGTGGRVTHWDIATGELLESEHEGELKHARSRQLVLSPDLSLLAHGTSANLIQVIDLKGNLIASISSADELQGFVRSLAFSPDGRFLASSATDSSLRLWDVRDGTQVFARELPSETSSLVFSPDGSQLASADFALRLWDAQSGEPKLVIATPQEPVSALAYDPSGRSLASASSDGSVFIWDLESGESLAALRGHTEDVTCLAFSGDGRRLVTGSKDRTVRVWDARTGEPETVFLGHTEQLSKLAVSEDGTVVVSAASSAAIVEGSYEILVWSLESSEAYSNFSGHRGKVLDAAFSPDGTRVVSGSDDGNAYIWDAVSGEVLNVLRTGLLREEEEVSASCVAFDPGGRLVATGINTHSRPSITVWDAETGEIQAVMFGHTRAIQALDFSGDGKRLISASDDKSVRLWNVESGEELGVLSGHTNRVHDARFSPDGETIASVSRDRSLRIWDAESGEQLKRITTGHRWGVLKLAFSPDGKHVLTASLDRSVRVWELAEEKLVATLPLDNYAAYSVAYSVDGRRIVCGDGEGSVLLWDSETYEELMRLRGHEGAVTAVQFSPDSRRVLSAAHDGTLRVWETGASVDRYKARREGARQRREAAPIVDLAFDRWKHMPMVISELQTSRLLTNNTRRVAVSLARVRGDDPEAFHERATPLVYPTTSSLEDYQLGLLRSQHACDLARRKLERIKTQKARRQYFSTLIEYLATLSAAYYRVGDFDACLGTIEELRALNGEELEGAELEPTVIAFQAMALMRSGDKAQAAVLLQTLEQRSSLLEQSRAKAFIEEARTMIR